MLDETARRREALESHTDKSGGDNACWPWTGKRNSGGYGVLKSGELAHRVSVEVQGIEIGPWPVCHRCDNRICVNPAHLYVGTAKSNTRDAIARGRHTRPDERYFRSVEAIGRRQARQEAWEESHHIEPGELSGISRS